jgi:hypothetical protein
MCRNIKSLRHPGSPPSEEEVRLAALQFVRKVSGYRSPSRKNQPAFNTAVLEVAAATARLFERLASAPVESLANPTDREG